MDLNEKYFSNGSRGFKILNRFYLKYRDLFTRTIFIEFDDFKNQIFLNISGIRLSEDIINEEAYIIGAIKIQCRVQLDKAIRSKKVLSESRTAGTAADGESPSYMEKIETALPDPHIILEGEELLNIINIFKMELKSEERDLLNSMIDEKTRAEIAGEKNSNLNTLDTHIRRLRIRFFSFLKDNGYNYEVYRKYEKYD
ncbi:MAG TPA: hypothetical protein VKD08_05600 [Ignavibacteriaceae bacterium]|jgi:hypothetical protein|nr:hypothetical protein [Ignavibacteriaceae bacterium]